MSYYEKVLQPGETVRFVGHLHWMIFRKAIVWSVCMLALGVVGAGYSPNPQFTPLFFLVPVLLSVVAFVPALVRRATTEIVITDKRIIHKVGFISRRTEEMNMTKVETVDVRQGLGSRVFGYGTVLIIGIGASWEPLNYVASPLELRNAIMVG